MPTIKQSDQLDNNNLSQKWFNQNQWTNRTTIGLVGMVMCMLTLFMFIHEELPKPYMDELFHVDQLHAYCAGNITYVNKISILFL